MRNDNSVQALGLSLADQQRLVEQTVLTECLVDRGTDIRLFLYTNTRKVIEVPVGQLALAMGDESGATIAEPGAAMVAESINMLLTTAASNTGIEGLTLVAGAASIDKAKLPEGVELAADNIPEILREYGQECIFCVHERAEGMEARSYPVHIDRAAGVWEFDGEPMSEFTPDHNMESMHWLAPGLQAGMFTRRRACANELATWRKRLIAASSGTWIPDFTRVALKTLLVG